MNREKIDRINALAHLSKTRGLTEAEREEQQALRAEYVQAVRQNMQATLDNTVIERPDGTVEKLRKKEG